MTARVLLWTPIATRAIEDGLLALDSVDLIVATSQAEFVARMPDAQGLVMAGHEAAYSAEVARAAAAAPKLKWLQIVSTGQDGLDRFGVPASVALGGIGDAHAAVVAEHAMSLLLALGRRLPESWQQARDNRWDRALTVRMGTLEGSTMCIAGFGRIGQAIARRAKGFGARCIAVNRNGQLPQGELADRVFKLSALDEALAQSDSIVIALPLDDDTRGCFAAPQWAACKSGALVVNIARGGLVDTPSLVDALRSGHLGGAGLDVTDPEPLPPDHALWGCPNLIVTPHVGGGGSAPSQQRMVDAVCANVRCFIDGRPPPLPIAAASHAARHAN